MQYWKIEKWLRYSFCPLEWGHPGNIWTIMLLAIWKKWVKRILRQDQSFEMVVGTESWVGRIRSKRKLGWTYTRLPWSDRSCDSKVFLSHSCCDSTGHQSNCMSSGWVLGLAGSDESTHFVPSEEHARVLSPRHFRPTFFSPSTISTGYKPMPVLFSPHSPGHTSELIPWDFKLALLSKWAGCETCVFCSLMNWWSAHEPIFIACERTNLPGRGAEISRGLA